MKRISIIFITVFIALLASCVKDPNFNFGFDAPINTNLSGLVIAHTAKNVNNVSLSGYVNLSEGETEVSLFNAQGVAIYSKTIKAPLNFYIFERFIAEPGYWKLNYKSNAGVGEINLHIYNLDM